MVHRTMQGRGVLFVAATAVPLLIAACSGPDAILGDAGLGGAMGSGSSTTATGGGGGASSSSGGPVEFRGEFAAAAFSSKDQATMIELQGRITWQARVQAKTANGITLEGWLR